MSEGLGNNLDRANYVVRIWKRADSQRPCDVGPVGHGCVLDAGTYKIQWYDGDQLPFEIYRVLDMDTQVSVVDGLIHSKHVVYNICIEDMTANYGYGRSQCFMNVSYLIYGITLWGATYKSSVNELTVMQKKVIRAMVSAKYNAHTDDLFNELGILKLDDVYILNVGKCI